ncbi:MAG: YdeI/OmpD-associated family protein [Pseudolysinimonas sp.]|uniref:YdeI/OmpD-associated family protein n=1 Tax=Pseudolysinimonas sp. TaxID=2680009 RepID=UPI003264254C
MTTFRTTLHQIGNNVGIVVPDDVVASLNAGKRVPVNVTIDGGYTYRSTIVSMGGRFLVGFNSAQRADTGLGGGDEVDVTLEHDTAPREVEVPEVLASALAANPAAAAAWEKLAYTHRKEHARSITEAKAEETRQRRVAATIAKLTS